MNVTLYIDENLLLRARGVAESMGKSVDQLICDYLEEITSQLSVEEEIAEFERLSFGGGGRSRGWKFSRDEVHVRP
jgi:hypothetical protein